VSARSLKLTTTPEITDRYPHDTDGSDSGLVAGRHRLLLLAVTAAVAPDRPLAVKLRSAHPIDFGLKLTTGETILPGLLAT
jgi:hypothetical protein